MVKNILKKLFFFFGLVMFLIGISKIYHLNHAILVVLGVISITLGWKYHLSK